MPANAKPLTVYGDGNKLRKALRRKITRGRQLLSELDAVESRWTSRPLGVSALTQAMDDSISYNGVTDALPTWERGVRNLLRSYLGAYADDVLPQWESSLDRDAPAVDLVADQRAFIEGRMIDLASLLQRVPGHPIDAAPPIFAELRAAGTYTAFDGAATLLGHLQNQPWALVTSNYAHRVRIRFARTHLPEPPLIIDAEAVSHGKPDPEGYLLAARALGVDPKECLVIEDSPAGVASARAAGATVWAVNAATPMPGADRTYRTLNDAVSDVLEFAQSIGR